MPPGAPIAARRPRTRGASGSQRSLSPKLPRPPGRNLGPNRAGPSVPSTEAPAPPPTGADAAVRGERADRLVAPRAFDADVRLEVRERGRLAHGRECVGRVPAEYLPVLDLRCSVPAR